MQEIQILPVVSRRERDDFIRLPDRLYADVENYVSPLRMERRKAINELANPYFAHAVARFFIAWRDGLPVGRISAQIDELFLECHSERIGHFGFLDAEDDPRVFATLLHAAERWLADQGMQSVTGPFSLSINQECGTLIDGFGERSMMLMGYDPPYADKHICAAGYEKARDLICYEYDVSATPRIMSERFVKRHRISSRLNVRSLDLKRYDSEMRSLLEIFNDAWSDNWGFVPITEAEWAAMAKRMKPILDYRMVWIARLDGEAVCMAFFLPNLNEAIADLDGRLLPFGWAKILWRLKVRHPKTGRVLLFGLKKAYQRSLLGSVLLMRVLEMLRQSGKALGYEHVELSWILEDNTVMRRLIESVGGREYKTYRIYRKNLG